MLFAQGHKLGVFANVNHAERIVIPHAQCHFTRSPAQVFNVKHSAAFRVKECTHRVLKHLDRRKAGGVQIGKASGEQVFPISGNQTLIQYLLNPLNAAGFITNVPRQELQDLYDVCRIARRQGLGYTTTHKDPKRLLDIEWPKLCFLFAIKALLLIKRQQAGHKITLQMASLRSLVQIEYLVILTESITVKIAIGVIKEDVFRVGVGEFLAALYRLTEGC